MLSPLRKERVTGSQAGAILGLSPYRTREDTMHDWLYGSTFEGNVATEHGKFYEEYALAALSELLNVALKENTGFFISEAYDWLGATPDALTDGYVCEIKCPYSKRNATSEDAFKPLADQPWYLSQVQIEMLCTGRKSAYFFQWAPTGAYKLETVELNPDWLDWALPQLESFVYEYRERKNNLSSDEELAKVYHLLKAQFESAKQALDDHKNLMIQKANGSKRKFADVQVYPVERKGSVAYAKVVKDLLPGVDLEPYRGEPSTSWVVK